MDYLDYTREQMLERLEELEKLNEQLKSDMENRDKLEFPWTGNLGNWYWDLETNSVTFNPLKVRALGYDESDIESPVTYQFFTEKLHPDDYDKTMENMKAHLKGESPVYEVEYRIKTKDGAWKWFYDRGAATRFNKEGKPVFLAGIVFDITKKKLLEKELENKNRELMKKSITDGLTMLKNHNAIMDFLRREMADSVKYKEDLSIILLDLDDFKKINDTKGHVFGDKVLKKVGKAIKKSLRKTDAVGRYGGEEFLVVLPFTRGDDALEIGERIRKRVQNLIFDNEVTVTISGGVKEYFGENLKDLVNAADELMYKAKKEGKNKVIY
ncbi:MAG: sensor domain-containing diguanylate cyclase [Bacillota bacterium]